MVEELFALDVEGSSLRWAAGTKVERAAYPGRDVGKFYRGARDGRHYWLTPAALYWRLMNRFHFTFDPCPYPRPVGFDGLSVEWGSSSYVNPPFGTVLENGKHCGPTAWVRKCIEESKKGKRVVFVYPIDKWILMLLEAGARVENLGDVKWCAIEDGVGGSGTGRHVACFILGSDQ